MCVPVNTCTLYEYGEKRNRIRAKLKFSKEFRDGKNDNKRKTE